MIVVEVDPESRHETSGGALVALEECVLLRRARKLREEPICEELVAAALNARAIRRQGHVAHQNLLLSRVRRFRPKKAAVFEAREEPSGLVLENPLVPRPHRALRPLVKLSKYVNEGHHSQDFLRCIAGTFDLYLPVKPPCGRNYL